MRILFVQKHFPYCSQIRRVLERYRKVLSLEYESDRDRTALPERNSAKKEEKLSEYATAFPYRTSKLQGDAGREHCGPHTRKE